MEVVIFLIGWVTFICGLAVFTLFASVSAIRGFQVLFERAPTWLAVAVGIAVGLLMLSGPATWLHEFDQKRRAELVQRLMERP